MGKFLVGTITFLLVLLFISCEYHQSRCGMYEEMAKRRWMHQCMMQRE